MFPKGMIYEEEGIVEDLHIPLFSVADLHTIPSKMAVMILFTAVTHHHDDVDPQIGAFVVASKDVCERVVESGIIESDMKMSLTSNITNRRGSVLDFGSQRPSLSAAGLEVIFSGEELALLNTEDEEYEDDVAKKV